jgi:hypothetical protein
MSLHLWVRAQREQPSSLFRLALFYPSKETDPEMRRLAQEIITDQQSEDERLRILTFLHGIRDGD